MPCIYSGTTTPAKVERLNHQPETIDPSARELLATRDRLDDIITDARHRLAA